MWILQEVAEVTAKQEQLVFSTPTDEQLTKQKHYWWIKKQNKNRYMEKDT